MCLFACSYNARDVADHNFYLQTELSKHVAKMYNALSEKKKQKYVQLAEQKKLEYNKEMNKFM